MALPNIINEINTIKSTYYTTSGGYLKNGSAIWMGDDDKWKSLDLHSPSGGASLHLRGGNSTNQPYSFVLSTSYEYEDDRRKMLYGDNTGALIWAGHNVITSAGGTFTGNLLFSNCEGIIRSERNIDAENRPLYQLSLGYESHSQLGGYILLRRGDSTAYGQAGMAALCASSPDGTRKYLMCYPNGALVWNDKPVLSIVYEAGGIITYSNGLTFQWGSSYGSTTVNFPQPFAGYPIVYTTNNAVIDSSCNSTTYVTGITPTYFTTYKIRGNSGNQVQDGGQFSWFALGYR